MSIELRKKRFDKAKERRINWEDTYREALRYTAQNREKFDTHTKGEQKYQDSRVYDSTAVAAVQKFASNLQSGLVPPFKKWMKLVPGTSIPEENKEEAEKQLEDISNVMFNYIHQSNFDTQISESFIDLSVGTGAMLVNEGDDDTPIIFTSVPLDELYLEEGPHGTIKTVFRHFELPARVIEATWIGSKVPEEMVNKKDPDAPIKILESTIYDEKTKKYEYTVDIAGKKNIFSEKRNTSPWVVFRWSTMPGEIYGRGPVLSAIADIKTLNKTVELLLKTAALRMIPTFVAADDGVINPYNIKIEPGAIIPAAQFGPSGLPIQPLQVGGDINLGQFVIERMQTRIDDIMFTNPLGDVNLPVKTATEISLRQQDLAKRIGSAFGRLQLELLSPLVNRILDILDKKGLLPVSLNDVKVDGKAISIALQSPLAQAQDEEELVNSMRYVETMAGTVGPQLLPLFVNIEKFSTIVANNLNVDKDMIPNEQQRAQAVQLMSQLAQGAQAMGQTEE